jgi:hypothetical protein
LGSTYLAMKVKENMSNLKLFLQKIDLKEGLHKLKLKIQVEWVKGEPPTPQTILQKPDDNIKIKHVK